MTILSLLGQELRADEVIELLESYDVDVVYAFVRFHENAPDSSQPGNTMSKLRVESFTISLDGFGAGPNQDIDNPLGVGGTSLHRWAVSTRTFQRMVFGS